MKSQDVEQGNQEPLLHSTADGDVGDSDADSENRLLYDAIEHIEEPTILTSSSLTATKSSIADSSWNLCNSSLGAGLYALPRVFASLGLVIGSLSISIAGIITYYSIDAMLRASEKYRKPTYASTMNTLYGRHAAMAVHAAIIACCAGFLALYIMITCDVIVGSAEYTGILNDLFPNLPDPLPWYLSRTALITWITLAASPLLTATTLHGMAATSAVSVVCSIISMVALVVLAIIAAMEGRIAHGISWLLPDETRQDTSPIVVIVATLPVVMTAFSSQMSIHPILQELEEYTPKRMRIVVGSSFSICTIIYILAGVSGYLVFGAAVQGDVLANIQPEELAIYFGNSHRAGLAFVTVTKLFVAGAMLTSIPINLWPMRQDILDLMHHWITTSGNAIESSGATNKTISKAAFYTATYSCLAAIYCLAVGVTSMYTMVQLVGGTCCVLLAFIYPGMLSIRLTGSTSRLFGSGLIGIGVVLMAAGVSSGLGYYT